LDESVAANKFISDKAISAGIKNDPRNYENLLPPTTSTT